MSLQLHIKFLIFYACLFLAQSSFASEFNIEILVSDNPQSKYVAKELQSKLSGSDKAASITTFNMDESHYTPINKNTLTISVGTNATSVLFKNRPNNAIYSLMVPNIIYKNISSATSQKIHHSALYLDQPFKRYLLLIRKLLPNSKRIGIFSNNQLAGKKQSYDLLAQELGFELIVKSINNSENPISEINELFSEVDVALLLPEKIINQLTAKWILYSAFRNHKPVIGFSKKFLDAGALASIHSNLDNIAEEASKDILYFLNHEKFTGQEHYPKSYEIEINKSISRSLNIPIENIVIDDGF